MASASELKSRIEGIRDTKKITDAMYMISSAKMRKALKDLEKSTPFFEAAEEKIGDLFHYLPKTDNKYFRSVKETDNNKRGVVLITSDKGFAGAYNHNAIALCEEMLRSGDDTTVFIIGECGRQYFDRHKMPYERDFLYLSASPQPYDARRICMDLLEYYERENPYEISIIYTDYFGSKAAECKKIPVLPLSRTDFYKGAANEQTGDREFFPDPDTLLEGVIPSYLCGLVYGSLVESFCSEQQARMEAMKNASDNAEKMLTDLRKQYNRIRQEAITGEMIEISAGANAQRKEFGKRN